MKLLPVLILFGLLLGGCQSPQPKHQDDFNQKTHRKYNPETGSFEQSPPWGKQSNKSDNN